MDKYSLADLTNKKQEVFKKAEKSPILLQNASKEYVIISAGTYQKLIDEIAKLEKDTESISTFVKKKLK